MSEPRSLEDDNSEICPCIWEDVQRVISEETVEAGVNLLLCAVQEIDDLIFKVTIQKLRMGKRRPQYTNQFRSVLKQTIGYVPQLAKWHS